MRAIVIHPCLALLTAGAAIALPGPAAAETCAVPPSGALSMSDSRDDVYVDRWCHDQSKIDALWNGLSLDDDDWDEGWGYENVCDEWLFLPRLLNAAHNLTKVQEVSKHFGEMNWPPQNLWWDFVKARETDGYEPKCCNDEPGLNATHYCCGYSTDLCIKWGYKIGAAVRSSTLVHEATHEDEGHVGDDECMNGGSCDTYYGAYNANTMQINYLYDAMSAYQIETVGGKVQRKVTRFTDGAEEKCSYISLWNRAERGAAIDQVSYRINNNFASGSVFPKYSDVDAVDSAYGATWSCKSCDPAQYTFSLAKIGQNKACNEIANTGNIAVNAANRAACAAFNQKIGQAPGAAEYQKLVNELYQGTKACQLYNPTDLDNYCKQQQQTASNVNQLDPYGILADNGYQEELECAEGYCKQRFDDAWMSHADDPAWDDPLGCLDLLCGDDAECRRRFLKYKANPLKYHPDHCTDMYLDCVEAGPQLAEKNGVNWGGALGPKGRLDATQSACQGTYQMCRAMEEMADRVSAMVLIEQWKPPGPGPALDLRQNPRVNPVEWAFKQEVVRLGQRRGSLGEAQFNAQVDALMRHPESLAAAFDAAPALVAGLFDAKEYGAIVGPQLARTTASLAAAEKLPGAAPLLGKFNAAKAARAKLDLGTIQQRLQAASKSLTQAQFDGVVKALQQAQSPAEVEAALAKAGP